MSKLPIFALVLGLILGLLLLGTVQAQTPPDIITGVSPASAAQGDTGVMVTMTLDSESPPTPPTNAALLGVTIGSLDATSHSRDSLTVVTAIFDFPADAALGVQDVSLTFEGPSGSPLTFTESSAFEILPGGPIASLAITKTVETPHTPVLLGDAVTYTIVVANDGDSDADVTVTDNLPAGVTGDDLAWTGTIVAGGQAGFTIPATVTTDPAYEGQTIVNTATYAHSSGSDSDSASFTISGTATIDLPYTVVDTAQVLCYDDSSEITCPAGGQAFYGQDAQYDGHQPSYTLSAGGMTVHDNVTGLTWTQSPDLDGDGDIDVDDKLTLTNVQAYIDSLNAQGYGGYDDWRLPTIKELYSLIDFRGTDPPVKGDDTTGLTPFIDTDYFDFGYGDTAAGERIIDAQFLSSSEYAGQVFNGVDAVFGVNLADGRIKGYPQDKTFFVYLVRGNTDYGLNDFVDNGDGTITDQATGLMWSQADSGAGMNWENTLAWVEQMNDQNYLGHDDWRLPNAKELQSIVDYTRSPDITGSAAIDPVFDATQITNEAGELDYPFYWSGTTHLRANGSAAAAAYVAFGRGLGSMDGVNVIDVHGAGCQRSDPKDGNPADYPSWGHGPQGDV